MVWLANAGLVHNYIILLCARPLWHLGVTVVGEGIGKSDLPKLISIHVVSQHTEAARTTTGTAAAAKTTATPTIKRSADPHKASQSAPGDC
jgi:hypothetical protein